MANWFSDHASQLGFLAVLNGCAPDAGDALVTRTDAVVGGTEPKPGDEATVYVRAARTICSGALVAPNVVVTAAHCVSVSREGSFSCSPDGDLEQNGSGIGELGGPIDPQEVAIHVGNPPGAEPAARGKTIVSTNTLSVCRDDLAFVVLDRSLNASPTFPIRLGDRVRVGETMTVLGYGTTGVSERVELHRREAVPVIDVGMPPRAFALGPGPCGGDSGGPALSAAGGITGIYSLLNGDCTSRLVRNTFTELAPFSDLVFEAFDRAGVVPNLEHAAEASGDAAAPTSTSAGCALPARAGTEAPKLAFAALLAAASLLRRKARYLVQGMAALALLGSLAWPSSARADTPREGAAEHFDRALSYVDQRDFALAIAEFERAYEIGKHYSVLYNLGLAYAAVGRYRDARETLTTYLREGSSTLSEERRRDVRSLIDGYEKKLVTLRIVTSPTAAEILIDAELQQDSSNVRVDPGRHVITARAAGYADTTVVVETTAAEERTLTLELRPAAPPTPHDAMGDTVPARSAAGRMPQKDQSQRSERALGSQRAAALLFGGASLAAFAVGAGFGIAANAIYQDSVDHCPRDQCDLQGFDDRQTAFDRARMANIAFAVGAAAAVGAGVLWLTAPTVDGARIGVGSAGTGRGLDVRMERRW